MRDAQQLQKVSIFLARICKLLKTASFQRKTSISQNGHNSKKLHIGPIK